MKIRVLHVIDHLGYGGAPFVVKNLVERMPTDQIDSVVCALRPNPKSIPMDAEVITLACRKYSPAAVRAIVEVVRRRQIDIIHAHLQKAVISGLLAKPRCASRLVLHEHGPIFRGGTGCVYRGFLRLLAARADAVIANSAAAGAAARQVLRGAEVPITVVPNFIDLERFDPNRYDREQVRRSLGLDPKTFVVGFVGRLDRAKGADLLVEAAARLRGVQDSYCFFIVGDGPERKRLADRVRTLSLERMVILAGMCEDPARVLRAFDVGVVPSRREAFGIAALEMMRMRVPVIVAPVGGLPELIRDGATGVILPRPDPEEIARAVGRLREDNALRETLRRNAFEYSSSFDGRRPVAQVVEIYERLMQSREAK